MAEIRWTQQAADDLEGIANFIGQDSRHYASLFVESVLDAVERIAVFPHCGRVVPETSDPAIREIILGSYRIAYRIDLDSVQILTVYHGARLLDPGTLTNS